MVFAVQDLNDVFNSSARLWQQDTPFDSLYIGRQNHRCWRLESCVDSAHGRWYMCDITLKYLRARP